jgi:ABC-type transporter Mla subunit MlaD
MTSPSMHFKLGLLTLAAVAAIAAMAVILAIQRAPVDRYHTYFDESVQGLDTGAMVKFRGVHIGKVTRISIAPDHRLIDVELSITRGALDPELLQTKLRAELTTFGITGTKLIDLDLLTPDTPLPPSLAFVPPKHYIPSRPSLISGLTRRLETISTRMLVLVDRSVEVMDSVHSLAADANELTGEARTFVRRISGTSRRLDDLIATSKTAVQSARELARATRESTSDIADVLRESREAARSMSLFLDALERDPDMLLKGRQGRQARRHR